MEQLFLLSKRLVTQAYVLVFRSSDRLKPAQTLAMDLRFSKEDIQKQLFITRLQSQEGLNEKSSELGLGSVNYAYPMASKTVMRPIVEV